LGIHVVPMRVHFGERSYLDKIGMSADQFFDKLASSEHHPQTSQPAPGDFRRMFEYLASHFDDVVAIAVTSGASGSFQAAQSSAKRVPGPGRVTAIDSRTASVGQGLVAMYAAECAAAGQPGPQVIEAAQQAMERTMTFALVSDLTYAVKGGRIKALHKRIADFLRVAVVLKLSNSARVVPGGIIPRSANPVRSFSGYVRRRIDPERTYRIAIGYAQNRELAEALERRLREDIPSIESVHLVELGAAIGAHGGPSTVVVAAQDYVAPE
ncbi:MAG: DegV family protein, partial [Gammaproteobacteria bacterium]